MESCATRACHSPGAHSGTAPSQLRGMVSLQKASQGMGLFGKRNFVNRNEPEKARVWGNSVGGSQGE